MCFVYSLLNSAHLEVQLPIAEGRFPGVRQRHGSEAFDGRVHVDAEGTPIDRDASRSADDLPRGVLQVSCPAFRTERQLKYLPVSFFGDYVKICYRRRHMMCDVDIVYM